jgi:hypothetical protein
VDDFIGDLVGDFIAAAGLEGLVEAGFFVGTRVGLVGLLVNGRFDSLDGALEALESFLTAIPCEHKDIIECKHIDKYSKC